MNAILQRIPFRLTPFSAFGLMLAVVGCGTIAVDVRTEILSQQEIKQNIEYIISGPIATLFITDGEIDLGEETDLADLEMLETAGWDVQLDVVQVEGEDAMRMVVSQTFTGEDAVEQFRLASLSLTEQDAPTSMLPLLEVTETEDEITYDLRMSVSVDEDTVQPTTTEDPSLFENDPLVIDGTPFPDPAGEFEDAVEGAFTDGLEDFTDALASSFEDFITLEWTVEMPGHVSESNATSEDGNVLTWELGLSDLTEGDDLFAKSVVSKNAGGSCNP